jgi:hypothetical protein
MPTRQILLARDAVPPDFSKGVQFLVIPEGNTCTAVRWVEVEFHTREELFGLLLCHFRRRISVQGFSIRHK